MPIRHTLPEVKIRAKRIHPKKTSGYQLTPQKLVAPSFSNLSQTTYSNPTLIDAKKVEEDYKNLVAQGELYKNKQTKKGLDFHAKWMNSPMYKEMLYKSDPVNAKNIERARWKNYNTTDASFKVTPADLYFDKRPGPGAISNSVTGNITIYPKALKENVSNIGTHEVSHSVDRPFGLRNLFRMNRSIPKADVNKIKAYSEGTTFDFYKYVADPTETRARLNDIRQKAYENNLYNPFTEKVTPEIEKKLLNFKFEDKPGWDPMRHLRGLYSDDEIIDLLNTVSKTNTTPTNTVNSTRMTMVHGGPLLVGNQHVAMGGSLYKSYRGGGPFDTEDGVQIGETPLNKHFHKAPSDLSLQNPFLISTQPSFPSTMSEGDAAEAQTLYEKIQAEQAKQEALDLKERAEEVNKPIAKNSAAGIALATSLVSGMSERNRIKREGAHNTGNNAALKGTASGMAQGASLGASFGPIGVAAGAIIGGAAGYFTGKAEGKRLKKEYDAWQDNYREAEQKRIQGQGSRYLDFRPSTAGMYAEGGPIAKPYMAMQKAVGGNLVPLSSDTVEVQGPSHAQGGVQLPAANAEVEGKEVIKDDYVFSDQLGFAKEAKKLAKAKGAIENKPATRERINSLKLLQDKENYLKLAQEFIRKQNNLQ